MEPPATAHLIRRLGEEGVVTRAQAAALEQLLRERLPWRAWAERVLLSIGAGLFLAGVVFFFAYNWAHLSPAVKFGVVEGGLLVCALAAWWAGLDKLGGKICLTAACVFTGVFLAVHGQIYQTGANTWVLFAAWAGVIAPWVILGRFPTLWVIWLALLNTAAVLWWSAAGLFGLFDTVIDLLGSLALGNAVALAAREWGVCRGRVWLDEGWVRPFLLLAVYAPATAAGGILIFSDFLPGKFGHAWVIVAIAGLLGGGYWIYRSCLHSLAALAIIVLSAGIIMETALSRFTWEYGHDSFLRFLGMAAVTVGVFGAAVAWLRREGQRLQALSQ